jgi:hypothetical protein
VDRAGAEESGRGVEGRERCGRRAAIKARGERGEKERIRAREREENLGLQFRLDQGGRLAKGEGKGA